MAPSNDGQSTHPAAREAAALAALLISAAWITFAFARSGSANVPLLHPMIAIGLVFFLWPFRRNVLCSRGVIVALVILGFWLAGRLSIVWVPFLSAFIIAYVARFVSRELRTIRLPGGAVIHLPRAVANAILLVGFVSFILIFAFVLVPSIIGQVAQLLTGARTAYTSAFLYRTEQITPDEFHARIIDANRAVSLGDALELGDGTTLPAGTILTPARRDTIRAVGLASSVESITLRAAPYFEEYRERANWVEDAISTIEDVLGPDLANSIRSSVQQRLVRLSEVLGNVVSWVFNRSTQLISGTVGFLATFVFTLVVLAYLLRAYDNYMDVMLLMFPVESWENVRGVARGVDRNLQAFLRGQFLIIIVIALLSWIAYSLAGIPFALLIGILGGLFNTIPNVGPALAGLVAALALLVGTVAGLQHPILFFIDVTGLRGLLVRLLLIPAAIFAVQTIDNSFISPRVMSRAVNIDPLMIMASVLAGGALFGFWGVLLAIPCLVIVKSAWEAYGVTAQEPPAETTPSGPEPGETSDLSDLI